MLHGHIDACAGIAGQIGGAQCSDKHTDVLGDHFHLKAILLSVQWKWKHHGEKKQRCEQATQVTIGLVQSS